jgi:hypothetical protein
MHEKTIEKVKSFCIQISGKSILPFLILVAVVPWLFWVPLLYWQSPKIIAVKGISLLLFFLILQHFLEKGGIKISQVIYPMSFFITLLTFSTITTVNLRTSLFGVFGYYKTLITWFFFLSLAISSSLFLSSKNNCILIMKAYLFSFFSCPYMEYYSTLDGTSLAEPLLTPPARKELSLTLRH